MSKCIMFIALREPDVTELAIIAGLRPLYSEVRVRTILVSDSYGDDNPEPCDVVASKSGVTIPASHVAKTNVGLKPLSFNVWPAAATLDLSNAQTLQLVAAARLPGAAAETDVAGVTARVTYASSDAAKATVSSTGLVTPIGTGAATITATYTDAHSVVLTDTCAVTVAA